STTVGSVNFIVTIFKLRAPGMSIARMPLYVWAILATSFAVVFALPSLTVANVMLELDRKAGFNFFNVAKGGHVIPCQLLFQIFAWIATIIAGRPVFKTPMLFILGFIFVFVMGGVTGVMFAAVPFDQQITDSYFVVAHFHYVLFGGAVFPIFAAIHYWTPKMFGRLMNEALGKVSFWLIFLGFNLTFFPMHIAGLLGMPRRVYTYHAGLGWDLWNL